MPPLLSILVVGFVLGMRHATDPDHVIAVATIVGRERLLRRAVAIGAAWGIGHTLTIMLVGGAIIVWGLVIPPRVGLSMEFSVGLMLIVLGLVALGRAVRDWSPGPSRHVHSHGDFVHVHPCESAGHGHDESDTPLARLDGRFGDGRGWSQAYRLLRPLVVGIVHGLAGSAAAALLVLTVIPAPMWGILYLLIFGGGTVAGMMLIIATAAVPFAVSEQIVGLHRWLVVGSGAMSLVFGIAVTYDIGVVQGLFGGNPHWAPG